MKINIPPKWDGFWRIVIFDVPEKFKKARNAFERKNKRPRLFRCKKACSFIRLNAGTEIDFVSEFFGTGKFVHYIVAKELDGEKFLKQHFGL